MSGTVIELAGSRLITIADTKAPLGHSPYSRTKWRWSYYNRKEYKGSKFSFIEVFSLVTIRMEGTLSYCLLLGWVVEETLDEDEQVLGFSFNPVNNTLETSKDCISLFVKYKS